ncbi:MAG: hypothetical protein HY721_23585, partial [Planctomycetes bacterium]|nr:hypothetical protein [Planctomycetota bacterium]
MHACENRPLRRSAAVAVTGLFLAAAARAQDAPFLSYDFEDEGGLDDFLNPTQISFCAGGIIPTGAGTIDSGELLITNDGTLGIGAVVLRPDVVESQFPDGPRNYAVRLRVNLESVNELLVYMRTRIGIDEAAGQIDSMLERGYPVVVIPQNLDPELVNGVLAIAEFTGCHTLIPHTEWPGSAGTGFARADPGVPIAPGDWYWLEISSQGDDDAGPILLNAKLWADGDDPPSSPQLTIFDRDGLNLDDPTRDPATEVQLLLGTSYDFGQQPGATCRVDDITFTQLKGCDTAPAKAARTLWGDTTVAQGSEVSIYTAGTQYDVSIALSDLRAAGACASPSVVTVTETLPTGWTASRVTGGGVPRGNVITWTVNVAAGPPAEPLKYRAKAAGAGLVNFQGELGEPGSTFKFVVEGPNLVADEAVVAPVSDFGSIQHWLILGPFTRQVGGAAPGDDQIVRDYLTDGAVTEADILPEAGDAIEPDYGGEAASTGLAANVFGRNPLDVPTWIAWRDFDDADDRIDFEAVYGDVDEVMCYAVTYLDVSEDTVVNFGVSSDDSVQILLDGEELHKHNVPRGALGRSYQDTPFGFPNLENVSLSKGQHVLLVKVFEGGGEHNFRVGFLDEAGVGIPGGTGEVSISLTPAEVVKEDCTNGGDDDGDGKADCADPDCATFPACLLPKFVRGDVDSSGVINLTDGLRVLLFLFQAGARPECMDAGDSDDSGGVQQTITDAIA